MRISPNYGGETSDVHSVHKGKGRFLSYRRTLGNRMKLGGEKSFVGGHWAKNPKRTGKTHPEKGHYAFLTQETHRLQTKNITGSREKRSALSKAGTKQSGTERPEKGQLQGGQWVASHLPSTNEEGTPWEYLKKTRHRRGTSFRGKREVNRKKKPSCGRGANQKGGDIHKNGGRELYRHKTQTRKYRGRDFC